MQEKDVARIVKELITNVESKIEAIEETEEYKALEEEIDKILIKNSRSEEEQKSWMPYFKSKKNWEIK